jgi:hypothetical protein
MSSTDGRENQDDHEQIVSDGTEKEPPDDVSQQRPDPEQGGDDASPDERREEGEAESRESGRGAV